jgi:hypothetical protein
MPESVVRKLCDARAKLGSVWGFAIERMRCREVTLCPVILWCMMLMWTIEVLRGKGYRGQ